MATSKNSSAHCNKAPCSCSRGSTPNQPFPSKSKQAANKKKPARKHCYRGKVRQTKNETRLHGFLKEQLNSLAIKAPCSCSHDPTPCNTPCSCSRNSTPNQPYPSKSKQAADKKKLARKHCYRGKVRQTKKETHLHGFLKEQLSSLQ